MVKRILSLILLIASAFLTLGAKWVFPACSAAEDGSFMSCHWAGQAVIGAGAVLIVLSVLLLVFRDGGKRCGIAAAMVPVALYVVLLPGTLIPLCMMAGMQCRSVMRPAVMLLGILILAIALITAFLNARSGDNGRFDKAASGGSRQTV